MGEIIAVISGKGGTGKTSVCAGLSTALADSGANVLCIDCDAGLRNLDISLGLRRMDALSFLDICRGEYDICHAAAHPEFPTLFFLTAPVGCTPGEIDSAAFHAMLTRVRSTFDHIFLDAPAGIDAALRLCCAAADRSLVVTGAEPAAVRDAAQVAQELERMGRDNARLILNRVRPKMIASMALTVDDVMDTAGLPLLGIVPEDENVTLAAAFDTPLLRYRRRCGASLACRRIAKRLQGKFVALPMK